MALCIRLLNQKDGPALYKVGEGSVVPVGYTRSGYQW